MRWWEITEVDDSIGELCCDLEFRGASCRAPASKNRASPQPLFSGRNRSLFDDLQNDPAIKARLSCLHGFGQAGGRRFAARQFASRAGESRRIAAMRRAISVTYRASSTVGDRSRSSFSEAANDLLLDAPRGRTATSGFSSQGGGRGPGRTAQIPPAPGIPSPQGGRRVGRVTRWPGY